MDEETEVGEVKQLVQGHQLECADQDLSSSCLSWRAYNPKLCYLYSSMLCLLFSLCPTAVECKDKCPQAYNSPLGFVLFHYLEFSETILLSQALDFSVSFPWR